MENLARANPDFTIAVALEHLNKDGTRETISVAINKIISKELFYCEKGFGAYLTNRRIRVSKRKENDIVLGATNHPGFLSKKEIKNLSLRSYGAPTLEIAYLAAAKLEISALKNSPLITPFSLLVKEAGGKVEIEQGKLVLSNGLFS